MSFKKTLAGVAPFAHLLSRAGAARAEENERDQREGESDEDYAKRMEELDEKEKAEEEKRKEEEAKRAEGNDVDGDDADADEETDDGKKAARATERGRCARILAHGIATGNVEQAAKMAFNTRMSSGDAIAILGSGAQLSVFAIPGAAAAAPAATIAPARKSLDERMAHARPANPGASVAPVAEPTLAEKILAAGRMRRGEQ
ncbi:hypothetical protein [Caballeronia sp. INSB1]|uniref:hypothetical protein n=1 Tax=Caballeronia sp. INSB1 TaxID=2921751 RepID=UPI0020328D00|nr:hypothetical protein [Caballeronia sp. INSB1]